MQPTAEGFRRQGYVIIRNLFTPQEVASYREIIEGRAGIHQTSAETPLRWNMNGGVSLTPELWPLITHARLLQAIRTVLGTSEICYTEQSDLKVWRWQPASGWHRDSATMHYNEGPEWGAHDYRIVRVACYFQPWEHAFMWGALPGSHCYEVPMQRWEQQLWQHVLGYPQRPVASRLAYLPSAHGRLWIRTQQPCHVWQPPAQPIWLRTRPTDAILFDPRLIHVGGDVQTLKVAALATFGANNDHTRRHRTLYSPFREDIRTKEQQKLSRLLRQADLLLV